MKTIIRLDVTDEQRRRLACVLAGKDVKRLATRDDVAAYVLGMVAALHRDTPEQAPTPEAAAAVRATPRALSPAEAALLDRLVAEGKPVGYAKGWIAASRRFFGGRLA